MGGRNPDCVIQTLVARPTPSLLCGNLCPFSTAVAYAHADKVVLLPVLPNENCSSSAEAVQVSTSDASAVTCVVSCSVGSQQLLVFGSAAGIQVCSAASGSSLLFEWKLPRRRSDALAASCAHAVRCAAFSCTPAGQVVLCAGDSCGAVHTFLVYEGPRIYSAAELRPHHRAPVIAISSAFQSRHGGKSATSDAYELVTADDSGQVTVWASCGRGATYDCIRLIDGGGVPSCALAVRHSTLICGRLDGTVRMYMLPDGQLSAEIVAHSRWLSALDIHPTADIIATCSEDCSVGVWQLPSDSKQVASLLFACCTSAVLTGVAFCGHGANVVVAVAYDCEEMRVWQGVRGTEG